MREALPRQIARKYRLEAELGHGGMAWVYLVSDSSGRQFAVKVMTTEFIGAEHEDKLRQRFAWEVEIARRIRAPFIPRFVEGDGQAEEPYLVTEFIRGINLMEAVTQYGRLGLLQALQLGSNLCDGVRILLREYGVLHRDIKPGNIMLTREGLYIIDFGIARAEDLTGQITGPLRLGSAMFMAQEILDGYAATEKSEVFSICATLAFAVSGQVSWLGAPDELRAILRRGLSQSPQTRPGLDELQHLLDQAARRWGSDTKWLPDAQHTLQVGEGRPAMPDTLPYTLVLRGSTQRLTGANIDPPVPEPRSADLDRPSKPDEKGRPIGRSVVIENRRHGPDLVIKRAPSRGARSDDQRPPGTPVQPAPAKDRAKVKPARHLASGMGWAVRRLLVLLMIAAIPIGYQHRSELRTWWHDFTKPAFPGAPEVDVSGGAQMLLCWTFPKDEDRCLHPKVDQVFQLQVNNVGDLDYLDRLCLYGYHDRWTSTHAGAAPVDGGSSCNRTAPKKKSPPVNGLIANNFTCTEPGTWVLAWDLFDSKGKQIFHMTFTAQCVA